MALLSSIPRFLFHYFLILIVAADRITRWIDEELFSRRDIKRNERLRYLLRHFKNDLKFCMSQELKKHHKIQFLERKHQEKNLVGLRFRKQTRNFYFWMCNSHMFDFVFASLHLFKNLWSIYNLKNNLDPKKWFKNEFKYREGQKKMLFYLLTMRVPLYDKYYKTRISRFS